MQRPRRAILRDFSGKRFTAPEGGESWTCLNPGISGEKPLVLGLGPAGRPPFVQNEGFYWLEDDDTLKQLAASPQFRPPPPENKIADPGRLFALAKQGPIFFYRPSLALAPRFWGPILARLQISLHEPIKANSLAWLPGRSDQLLHQELLQTLREEGFAKVIDRPFASEREFLEGIGRPKFALSVNFRGLDAEGRLFNLCRELGIPLAIWLVDNPWHLVSSFKLPWWLEADLFVTDASFIPELKLYGAKSVHHCPLAVAPHMWRESAWRPTLPTAFVGRASFPKREAFFGKTPLDQKLLVEAETLFARGGSPDYHWWHAKSGARLWPGLAGREPGKGADYFSALNRMRWLKAIQPQILVGDPAWRDVCSQSRVLPPVDYYKDLADLYHNAGCLLNVTSLLLPQSLSQRHFDVWAAGSPLLSDATQGLEIFPPDLVEPIRLQSPEEFSSKWNYLKSHPAFAQDLIGSWREHLRTNHTYGLRLGFMRKILASRP